MKIKLWKHFLKQRNSTRQPSEDPYLTLEGYLNDSCSILSPVINFEYDGVDLQTCNYAYVEEYKRYYFIEDWTTNYNLWSATMTVDVMGTYKTNILASKQYVTRSEKYLQTFLTDTTYPTTNEVTIENIEPLNNAILFGGEGGSTTYSTFARTAFADGYAVVGVTGATATSTGVTYYVMPCNSLGLGKLISGLYQITPSSFGDIGSGLAKALADPIQYITTIYWYPRIPDTSLTLTAQTIPLGFYEVTSVYCAVCDPVAISQIENVMRFNLTEHPQMKTYGKYTNYEPYSQYYFTFMPFGSFKINPDYFMLGQKIRLHFRNDITTGKSEFTLYAETYSGSGTYTNVVYKGSCATGVELPITQRTTDYAGGIGSVVGALGSAALGNVVGTAVGIVSAGASFGGAGSDISSKGSLGGVVNWDLHPQIQVKRYIISGYAPSIYGNAYCEYAKLSDLSGYTRCDNASMADFAKEDDVNLISEMEEVINYLNNGFYIE